MERKIITLSVGKPKSYKWKGNEEKSGIGKSIIQETLLTKEGFSGDAVENTEFHGGPDRAVCLYPYEHYHLWGKEFNRAFNPPSFGENICVTGMLEKDVFIGDIFSLGDVLIQVSQGRIPCSTISKHNGEDRLLGRIVETGFTGYFFRVIEEGAVNGNSQINLIDRVQDKISVLSGNYTMFHDRANRQAIEDLLSVKELAAVWRGKLESIINSLENKPI